MNDNTLLPADIPENHVLVTGGAGYIGSLLTGELLRLGKYVTVVDDLLFGGESLLAYLAHPRFHFYKANLWEPRTLRSALPADWPRPEAVVHLAAIVGFPACQAVGRQVAWRYNVEVTERVFEQATILGANRLVYASTYSNYGLSPDGKPVTEESPLTPQSLYAETKIAAERYLLAQAGSTCSPLIFRLATLYGISPRTRFDLIINQFVLEAFTRRELLIYQRGYSRSFMHVRDAVRGFILGLPQAFFLGVIAGFMELIPNVGPILAAVPAVLVALLFGSTHLEVLSELVRDPRFKPATVLLEAVYIAECPAPPALEVGRFLPPTALRLVLDGTGRDLSAALPHEALRGDCLTRNRKLATAVIRSQAARLKDMLERGEALAQAAAARLRDDAQARMQALLGEELDRLRALAAINPLVRAEEIAHLEARREHLTRHLAHTHPRLDALRVIVTG